MNTALPARPSRVYLDLTNRCQLRCRHCCTDSGQPFEDELSTDEILGVVDQVQRMGVANLVISGGEPLMRAEARDILAYSTRRGLRVTLLTNALLVSDGCARSLAGWGVRVKVSLDGATAATHDWLRGAGTFERTTAALRKLSAAGAPDLAVHCTVHRRNLHELPALPPLLRHLGVANLVVGTIKPSGRARLNRQLLIPPAMAPYVQQVVASLRRQQTVRIQHLTDKGWDGFGCPAVCNKLGITASGRLTTCAFFGADMLGASIRSFPLEELWRRHLARGATFVPNATCRVCPAVERCGGGCRARARYYHGDINATDPYCCAFHRKKLMVDRNRDLLDTALLDPVRALAGRPRPLALDPGRYASRRFAARFDRLRRHDEGSGRALELIRGIREIDDTDVVELGAGTGAFTVHLARLARRVSAFDRSPFMLERAERKLRALGVANCTLAVADHRNIPLPDGSADLVVMAWSLASLVAEAPEDAWRLEVDRVVAEMRRLARPDGAVAIVCPASPGRRDYPGRLEARHGFRRSLFTCRWRFPTRGAARRVVHFFFSGATWAACRSRAPEGLGMPSGLWWWSGLPGGAGGLDAAAPGE